ncbi:Hypothetical protein, putative, partial [Bodo saltans]
MNLSSFLVTTLVGPTFGYADGSFSTAKLKHCMDVVYRGTPASMFLYIVDYGNSAVRKANLITSQSATVSSTLPGPYFAVLSRDGAQIFVACDATIVKVSTVTGAQTTLAGAILSYDFVDDVGSAARFNQPRGVALNRDETVLFIGDWRNYRLRRLQLSTLEVTTVAGTGGISSIDGPLLSSTFVGLMQMVWHCDALTSMCVVILAEFGDPGNVQWIPLEGGATASMSVSTAPSCEETSSESRTPTSVFSSTPSSTLRTLTQPTTMTAVTESATPSTHSHSISFTVDHTRTLSLATCSTPVTLSHTPTTTISAGSADASQSHSRAASASTSMSSTHKLTVSLVRWTTTRSAVESDEVSNSRSSSLNSLTNNATATSSHWLSTSPAPSLSKTKHHRSTSISATPSATLRHSW